MERDELHDNGILGSNTFSSLSFFWLLCFIKCCLERLYFIWCHCHFDVEHCTRTFDYAYIVQIKMYRSFLSSQKTEKLISICLWWNSFCLVNFYWMKFCSFLNNNFLSLQIITFFFAFCLLYALIKMVTVLTSNKIYYYFLQ